MTNFVEADPGAGGPKFAADTTVAPGFPIPYARLCHLGQEGTALTIDILNAALAAMKVQVVDGASTLIDNSTFTPSTDGGLVIMGFADDVSPAAADEGKVGALRMSKGDRILYVRPGLSTHAVLSSAAVSVSASGDNPIVAAVASQTTKLMAFDLWAAAAVSIKWRSGTTDLQGVTILTANGSNYSWPLSGEPWGETGVNAALNLNLSAAVAVTGRVWYSTSVPT